MSNRCTPKMTVIAVTTILLGSACSQTSRYRVLTFFFEGVPPPGGFVDGPNEGQDGSGVPGAFGALPPKRQTRHLHPPFKDMECRKCHDMYAGKMVKLPEEGLCLDCHAEFLDERPFLHGPAAVNACLLCHHYHESERPKLLLDEAQSLCLICHVREDLLQGEHHDTMESTEGGCTTCHDPHGGNNRFFLK